MESKQKLGPLQKKWVKTLRSGKYKQGKEALKKGEKYCCLGVLCDIEQKLTTEGYVKGTGNEAYLPKTLVSKYSFHSEEGNLKNYSNGKPSLVVMNDKGYTFKEIADFIEQNPEQVFKQSK